MKSLGIQYETVSMAIQIALRGESCMTQNNLRKELLWNLELRSSQAANKNETVDLQGDLVLRVIQIAPPEERYKKQNSLRKAVRRYLKYRRMRVTNKK
jgi:hypothetical protein